MKNKFLIIFCLTKIFTQVLLYSHFEDIPIAARISGLNNCSTALEDDIFTGYFNPAGVHNLENLEVGIDYNKLHLGISDGSDIASNMILVGKKFDKIGGFVFGYRQIGLANYYFENTTTLGFGKKLLFYNRKISAGIKINLFNKSLSKTIYTENAVNLLTGETKNNLDPVFANGYSKSSVGFDIGFIYNFSKLHYFGILFENINTPDLGLKEVDVIPLNMKIGYVLKYFNIRVLSDMVINSKGNILSFAGEREINLFKTDKIILRGGLGFGSKEYTNLSLGASFVYKKMFQFDYSFNYLLRGIANLNGSHQISLVIKFDSTFFVKN